MVSFLGEDVVAAAEAEDQQPGVPAAAGQGDIAGIVADSLDDAGQVARFGGEEAGGFRVAGIAQEGKEVELRVDKGVIKGSVL